MLRRSRDNLTLAAIEPICLPPLNYCFWRAKKRCFKIVANFRDNCIARATSTKSPSAPIDMLMTLPTRNHASLTNLERSRIPRLEQVGRYVFLSLFLPLFLFICLWVLLSSAQTLKRFFRQQIVRRDKSVKKKRRKEEKDRMSDMVGQWTIQGDQ